MPGGVWSGFLQVMVALLLLGTVAFVALAVFKTQPSNAGA
jgi:hypothetical protein